MPDHAASDGSNTSWRQSKRGLMRPIKRMAARLLLWLFARVRLARERLLQFEETLIAAAKRLTSV